MRNADLRKRLLEVPIPDEHEARARSWEVVRSAFGSRERVPWPRRHARRIVALAAVLALGAAAASPAGRSLVREARKAVAVEPTRDALVSLPAPGRLLVVSAEGGGVWLVRSDGSRRRLGDYDDAGWSPRGLFVVATRRNALLAIEPDGDERWSLARRDVAWPRWSPSGYRIAYHARSGLRIVAGDGTGDRLLDPDGGTAMWHPRLTHALTYVVSDEIVHRDVDSGRVLWRRPVGRAGVLELHWTSDGRTLLAVSLRRILVLDDTGRLRRTLRFRRDVINAAVDPRARRLAVHLRRGGPSSYQSEVRLLQLDGASRQLVAGAGTFGELVWSPDGDWLLVDWRTADQWLFVRTRGQARVRTESDIAAQFPRPQDDAAPMLLLSDRWCCSP